MDVQPLHNHEDHSRQDARQNGMAPLDPCIGHKREKQYKSHYGNDEGRDMQEERHRLAKQLDVGQERTEGLQEDAHTAGDDHDEWQNQEDADVVNDLAVDGA